MHITSETLDLKIRIPKTDDGRSAVHPELQVGVQGRGS